jgi:hypothetical protein
MSEENLRKLGCMIEEALTVAVELDETIIMYLLSMASIEATEKIEAASSVTPDEE